MNNFLYLRQEKIDDTFTKYLLVWPKELHKQAKEIAKKENVSLNLLIQHILKEYLKKKKVN